MPEGDTIARAASAMHAALAGRRIERFASTFPALAHADPPIAGRRVRAVEARGKHLLVELEDGAIVHLHLRMSGSLRVYPKATAPRRGDGARIEIETDEVLVIGWRVPVAELTVARDLGLGPRRSRTLRRGAVLPPGELGPDLARVPVDLAAARARVRTRGEEPVGEVLLDQRVVAGIGNVLRSEILFTCGVSPFAPVASLDDATIERLVGTAHRLLVVNARAGGPRRTRGSLDPRASLWVYGRAGRPCRRCGTLVETRRTGVHARTVYLCPSCQGSEPPAGQGSLQGGSRT